MDDNNPRLVVLQLHLPIPNVMFCLHQSLPSTALLVSSLLQHRRCFALISISVTSIQVRKFQLQCSLSYTYHRYAF